MNKIMLEAKVPSHSKLLKFCINGVWKKKQRIPELESVRQSLFILKTTVIMQQSVMIPKEPAEVAVFYHMYVSLEPHKMKFCS